MSIFTAVKQEIKSLLFCRTSDPDPGLHDARECLFCLFRPGPDLEYSQQTVYRHNEKNTQRPVRSGIWEIAVVRFSFQLLTILIPAISERDIIGHEIALVWTRLEAMCALTILAERGCGWTKSRIGMNETP